jgi:hypothetical protein
MPLWRFKVNDFVSPIEAAIGIRPKIITADGVQERPTAVGWLERWRARRQIAAIRKEVESANGVRIRWNDEGECVYAEQAHGLLALQVFAKWLDCRDRLPKFSPPSNGDYAHHSVGAIQVDRLSCPHLVKHDCHSGYYLPCEFEYLAQVEPYMVFGHWPATRPVGSSPRLLRELDMVQAELSVPADYQYSAEDPLAAVKEAYWQLREVAELSCRHGLPIIFCG